MRILKGLALAVGVLFLLTLARLARLDHGGPAHSNVELPGQEPGTLYLPGAGNPFFNLFPPPPSERPAAVVLVHGFMADRQTMSALARRIAENGYAVLAIDVDGHGENRNPLTGGPAMAGTLDHDVKAAVDFLRSFQRVDGSRIVVMGHSMGAGAALDYATRDASLKGAVMISGGFGLAGPERPKNALFIFAERDPEFIQSPSTTLTAHLAGVEQLDLGKVYGDFSQGNAVEAVSVPGVDHVQIVYSADAARTIVKWLDSTFATARTGAIDVGEPRLGTSELALLLFVILLVPIGRIAGSLAQPWEQRPAGASGWLGILIVGGALLAAMPTAALIPPLAFLEVVVGDVQISWFAAAGVILLGVLAIWKRLDWGRIRDGFGGTLFAAGLAFAVIYFSMAPMAATFHRMSLSPERLVVFMLGTLLLLPFWLGFELLVRRGGVALSTTIAAIGRAVILLLMFAGVILGVISPVVMLVLPILALEFVMMEIFAASAYSTSRNLAVITLVETAWFAWMIAATNPITFIF
jgi:dienelactone hydrolase